MDEQTGRKDGAPRPLTSAAQITEGIAEMEKVVAALDELRELYIRYVFTNMPMGLAVTQESITEDMQHLNLMRFRQQYIRSSLIVMLYELGKQSQEGR